MPQTADTYKPIAYRVDPLSDDGGHTWGISVNSVNVSLYDWTFEIHWPSNEWRYEGDAGFGYVTLISQRVATIWAMPFNTVNLTTTNRADRASLINRVFRLKGVLKTDTAVIIYPVMGFISEELAVVDHIDGSPLTVDETNWLIGEQERRHGWRSAEQVEASIEGALSDEKTYGPMIKMARDFYVLDSALAPGETKVLTSTWGGLSTWGFVEDDYEVGAFYGPGGYNKMNIIGIHREPMTYSIVLHNTHETDTVPAGTFVDIWAQDTTQANPGTHFDLPEFGTLHSASHTLASDLIPGETRDITVAWDATLPSTVYKVRQSDAPGEGLYDVFYTVRSRSNTQMVLRIWPGYDYTLVSGSTFVWETKL